MTGTHPALNPSLPVGPGAAGTWCLCWGGCSGSIFADERDPALPQLLAGSGGRFPAGVLFRGRILVLVLSVNLFWVLL